MVWCTPLTTSICFLLCENVQFVSYHSPWFKKSLIDYSPWNIFPLQLQAYIYQFAAKPMLWNIFRDTNFTSCLFVCSGKWTLKKICNLWNIFLLLNSRASAKPANILRCFIAILHEIWRTWLCTELEITFCIQRYILFSWGPKDLIFLIKIFIERHDLWHVEGILSWARNRVCLKIRVLFHLLFHQLILPNLSISSAWYNKHHPLSLSGGRICIIVVKQTHCNQKWYCH